jgi:tripartite-type tricarboxylate transporter receptor subunit TctC
LKPDRRLFIASACALALTTLGSAARAADFPTKPIEIVVPASAGGGTDILARVFAELAKKYLPQQPMLVINKPGASTGIGISEVANARPDGYKVGMVTVELAIIPNLGIIKQTADDLRLIARLNADPAAITVRADSPWKTYEEFMADAKSRTTPLTVGNSGVGSIWHMGAAALADKTGVRFNHVPFQGSAPGVVALLGGHVDALALGPGEVSQQVAAGKLRTLAIMADQRVGGQFEKVPTLKERGVDLTVLAWRGLALPKDTPQEVVTVLSDVAKKVADDPAFREALVKANLGWSYADGPTFLAAVNKDRVMFRDLVKKLDIKVQ